ncbi:MAG: hypothetical protein LBB45_08345 [Methanobrevibacter sp.]|jgi:hypothetical protein|nr:hypothetical protein [Candidatus Methanovirga basalitermitum]
MSKYSIKAIAEPTKVIDSEIENPSTTNIKDEILLFQTGYLTVDKVKTEDIRAIYNLKIPNYEIKSALSENLIHEYSIYLILIFWSMQINF